MKAGFMWKEKMTNDKRVTVTINGKIINWQFPPCKSSDCEDEDIVKMLEEVLMYEKSKIKSKVKGNEPLKIKLEGGGLYEIRRATTNDQTRSVPSESS